jgi:hypothetical protein
MKRAGGQNWQENKGKNPALNRNLASNISV